MNPFFRDDQLEKWLSFKAIQMGKQCGEFCEHWTDGEHLQSLDSRDKQDAYLETCFAPILIISAADGKVRVQIKCSSCSFTRFYHTPLTKPELFCKKQFPTLERLLEEEFNKFLRKRHDGADSPSG